MQMPFCGRVDEIAFFFIFQALDCALMAIEPFPEGMESSLASYFLPFFLKEEGFNRCSAVRSLQVFMCVTQKFTFKQRGIK